jgi:DNA-binding CsgD family transcriptional regulator
VPTRLTGQATQTRGASDEGAAGAYADATLTRLSEWAERAGVNLYQAAIEAVMNTPMPEVLPRLLRGSSTFLAGLTETYDPALVGQLEALGVAAPPGQAPAADHMAWVETVRQAMRARIIAAGEDPDVLAAIRAGRPLRTGGLSEESARVLLPAILVLGLVDLYVASLGGRQAVRRHVTDTLAGMLFLAEQGGLLYPTPLQAPAPADDLVQTLAVAHTAATTTLRGVAGTRLRTALLAREQGDPWAAAAALAEELPGAVAVARADVGAEAGAPATLGDVGGLLDQMRTRAAAEVEQAQAVDVDSDSRPRAASLAKMDASVSEWSSPTESMALDHLEMRARLRRVSLLTPRERQVLQLIADGCSQLAVSETLGISVDSVRVHLSNARRKVNPPPDSPAS